MQWFDNHIGIKLFIRQHRGAIFNRISKFGFWNELLLFVKRHIDQQQTLMGERLHCCVVDLPPSPILSESIL